jgi:ABC-type bacteriocin/lantibiotic exporter with double-glycine peptidase domain
MSVLVLLVVAMLTTYGVIGVVQGGLALSMSSALANNVYLLAWALTDFEVRMNSVERLRMYHEDLPQEQPPVDNGDIPSGWPSSNQIQVKDLVVCYSSRKAPVLDSLNLQIPSGQRVGIIGRTGK